MAKTPTKSLNSSFDEIMASMKRIEYLTIGWVISTLILLVALFFLA